MILLSVYSSGINEEKLFGDIICYEFSKSGLNKFVLDHIEDIDIESRYLPSFKYISDTGTPFYMSGGRYLLMYATKVQDRNSIVMNYDSPKFRLQLQRSIVDVYSKSGAGELQTKIAAIKRDLFFLSSLIQERRSKGGKTSHVSDLLRMIDTYRDEIPIRSGPPVAKITAERANASNDPLPSVSCNLSADQIALFLRAIDDSRLVSAKSMSHVFRTIVPFLSTRHKKVLPYKAVRSKAYQPEENDRFTTIQAMEKIIEMIKGY